MRAALKLLPLLVIFSFGSLFAQSLKDTVNPSREWPLKWRTKIGVTTFKTNMVQQENRLFIGSNGNSTKNLMDYADGVYVLDAKTGDIVRQIKTDALGDTDVNGVAVTGNTVFFGNDNNVFYATTTTGNIRWKLETSGDIEGVPAIADFNRDGVADVCFGTESGELFVVNGKTGEVLWKFVADFKPKWTYPAERSFVASPLLVDLNKDGIPDVVIGSRNGSFYAFNGRNGLILWEIRNENPAGIHASAIYKDGVIVFADAYERVYKIDTKAVPIEDFRLNNGTFQGLFSSPVLTSSNTIAIGSSWPGSECGAWIIPAEDGETSKFIPLGRVSATPVVADFLGAGVPQIGFTSETGFFAVCDESGTVLAKFKLPAGAEATPFITDVDGDGVLDILFATQDGFLNCYALPAKPKVASPWPSFRGNPDNTGCYPILTPAKTTAPATLTALVSASPKDSQFIVSELGIGPAKLGMTLQEVKAAMAGPNIEFKPDEFLGGYKALNVMEKGESLFLIVFPAWQPLKDEDPVSMLVTFNPNYHTVQGISPSSPLGLALTVYGPPTLTLYPNEGREMVTFPKSPEGLFFAATPKSGIYRDDITFKSTKSFTNGARILYIGAKR
ncbi:MAG: PQQ-binding-like beta-propeller repeat protein [Candidatus Margulisiibacteriota bacterium]